MALLCMLRLLHSSNLPPGAAGLRCICFGTPAVGDAALAAAVAEAGWQDHILFYTLAGGSWLFATQRMPLQGTAWPDVLCCTQEQLYAVASLCTRKLQGLS